MKGKTLAGLIVAGLVMSGATFSLLAQNGPGQGRNGCGKGYGGPPQSQEERAARQAACREKNGGICQNAGQGQIVPQEAWERARALATAGGMDCATAPVHAARTACARILQRKR